MHPGDILRVERLNAGETIADVARTTHIPASTISRCERGTRRFTDAQLIQLAEHFGLNANSLHYADNEGRVREIATAGIGHGVVAAALALGCSPSQMRLLARARKIGHIKNGSRYVFTDEHIEAYKREHEFPAARAG